MKTSDKIVNLLEDLNIIEIYPSVSDSFTGIFYDTSKNKLVVIKGRYILDPINQKLCLRFSVEDFRGYKVDGYHVSYTLDQIIDLIENKANGLEPVKNANYKVKMKVSIEMNINLFDALEDGLHGSFDGDCEEFIDGVAEEILSGVMENDSIYNFDIDEIQAYEI